VLGQRKVLAARRAQQASEIGERALRIARDILDLDEFRDLALEVYIAESITAVEWGDIVEQDFPQALSIEFEFVANEDNSRKLTFSAAAEKWQTVLSSLKNQV